jgi:hypothetical protein
MKNRPLLHRLWLLSFLLLAGAFTALGQPIRYKLERDASGTYRVYMRSSTTYSSVIISSAQVTLLVPTGALMQIPQGTPAINNIGVWTANTRIGAATITGGTINNVPTTVPANTDFLSVGLNSFGTQVPGGMVAGQDYLLFSFNTSAACTSGVRLWQPGDPDRILFSGGGSGVMNQITITPYGLDNAYADNYSTAPLCAVSDVVSAMGPVPPLVESVTAQLPVSLTNIGTASTNGPLTVSVTLPASVSAPGTFTALNGWGCATTANVVSCTNAGPIAPAGTSAFSIPVTPLTGTAGQQPQFTGVVSTTLDGNSSNNNPAPVQGLITGTALQPDLVTSLGPVPVLTVGQTALLPVTIQNLGNATATGPLGFTTTLPASVSAPASFTSLGGWGCNTVGQVVTCSSLNGLPPGQPTLFNIPITPLTGTAGQTPSFGGAVSTASTESNTTNNTALPSVSGPILPAPTSTSCAVTDCGTGVRYGLKLNPDGITYTVYMLSQNAYSGAGARISTAQATIKVPTGMQITNVTSANPNTLWTMNARVNAPIENPTRDYLSFNYTQSITTAAFTIPPGTEIPLFSFQRVGPCPGEVGLWGGFSTALEPFQGASVGNNPGNQMTLWADQQANPGGLAVNAWQCNYTCPVACPSVQLSLVKQAPAGITQNVPFSYSMTVMNTGSGPSLGTITVTDVLPASLQFVSGGGNGWACSANSQTVTCQTSSPIAASSTSSFPLQVLPTSLATISNSATLMGGGTSGSVGSSPCATCPVGPSISPVSAGQANIALSLNLGGPLAAGQVNILTATITNTLSSVANAPLSVTLSLPVGLNTPALFAPVAGWSCQTTTNSAGNQVVCSSTNSLVGNTSVSLPIPVTPQSVLINNPLLIQGTAGAVLNEANLTDNSTYLISSVQGADIQVVFGTLPTYVPNTSSFVPLVIQNVGLASAPGALTVNVTLPAGISLNSAGVLPAGWSVVSALPSGSGQIVTLQYANVGGLLPTASVSLNLPVLVGTSVGTSLPFVVYVAPMPSENFLPNNSSSVVGSTVGGPDLVVTIGGPTPAFVVNQPSVVVITVSNAGSQSATGPFALTVTLPAGYVPNTSGLPAGWSLGSQLTGPGGTTLVLNHTAGVLLPLGTLSLNLPVTPPMSAAGLPGTFVAVVTVAPGETNGSNNGGSLTATPNAPGIGGSVVVPGVLVLGQSGQITIVLTNNGVTPYTGPLTTIITLPTTVVPSSTLPGGWVLGPGTNNGNGTISYPVSNPNVTILAGGNVSILVGITPGTSTPGTSVTIALTTPAIPGVASTNITIVQVVPVQAPVTPNVVVVVSSPTVVYGVGAPTIINITLTNNGLGAVSGPSTMTLTMPVGLSLVPGQLPAGWAIIGSTNTPGGIVYVLSNPNAQMPANGGSVVVSFPVVIGQQAAGTAPTITVVVGPAGQSQPSSGFILLTTISAPTMVLAVGQPLPVLVINQTSSLPVSFSNTGSGVAYGPLTINVVLPAGVQYVPGAQVLPAGWVYSGTTLQGTQTVLIFSNPNAGGFAPGTSVQINVPIVAVSGAGTTPSITVYLAPMAGQLTGPSVTIIVQTAIQQAASPDLIVIAYQPNPVLAVGQASSVSVVIQNQGGAATAGGISVQITVPSGMVLGSSLPAGWFESNSTPVVGGTLYTLTNSTLIIGGNSVYGFSLLFTPGASLAGTFISLPIAVVAVPGEIVVTNNGFTLVIQTAVQAAAVPDLAVTIPAGQTIALAVGQTSLLSFNVANIGGAAAPGPLSLTFAMPNGFTTNPTTFLSGGWSCAVVGSQVVCTNAAGLGVNASSAISIPVLPLGAAAGHQNPSFLISVQLASGETSTFNNVGIISVLGAVAGPDLVVSFPAQSFTLVGGQASSVLLNVSNASALAATGGPLSLTFAMPAGYFTSNATFSTNGWTCTTTGSNVACTYPFGLAPGASIQLTIPVQPLASAGGVVLNPSFVAVVAGVVGETQLLNNSATLQYIGLVQVGAVTLSVKALLMGGYDSNTGLLRDDLRSLGLIPLTHPYLTTPSNPVFAFPAAVANTATTQAVLNVTGPNAIVDWVVVELRSATNNALMVSSMPALIQRDGDIVMASDGVSPLTFAGVSAGSYYVVVRHRNHLGVMSVVPVTLGASLATYDLSVPGNAWTKPGFSHPTYTSANQRAMLWAGNTSGDATVIFQGGTSDVDPVITSILSAGGNIANYILNGYRLTDVNLNGQTIFQGQNNEPDLIFFTIMGHPGNALQLANYIVHQHLP